MRTRRISSAVICFARVLGITPSGLHLPISRPDGQESIVSRDPNAEGRQLLPQKTSETEFHTLRHNISYDQESPCLWSTNHTKQYCVFADQQFDNGQGIILITTRERAPHFFDYIASTSAGRRGSTRDPLYRTVATEVKGRGIFANRHIPAGTLITQESPIIFQDQNWVDDVDSEEARTALQELAFDKLPFATSQIAKEFYGGDGGRQKVTVNSYGLPGRPTEDWPWLEDDSDHGIMSAHANISKINHNCRANASPQWDWKQLAHQLYAVRDIAANEEITISYFDTIQTHEDRQKHTQERLGFKCSCTQCKAEQEFIDISDDRVNEILLLQQALENRQIAPAEPTAMAQLLVDLYEQEELHLYLAKAYAIAALEWNGQGYEYQARSWAYRAAEAGLYIGLGAGVDEYLSDMEELLDGARVHWSWKYRAR